MRKSGILNPALAARINRLGHTDSFAIADCGLPIPPDIPVVDLSLVFGVPRLGAVVAAVLEEVVAERFTVAAQAPADVRAVVRGAPILEVDHEEFKRRIGAVSFVVRTGEATPYANVIIHCGVPF